jgi:hypothetical protein
MKRMLSVVCAGLLAMSAASAAAQSRPAPPAPPTPPAPPAPSVVAPPAPLVDTWTDTWADTWIDPWIGDPDLQEKVQRTMDQVQEKLSEAWPKLELNFEAATKFAQVNPNPNPKPLPPSPPVVATPFIRLGPSDGLYDEARNYIDRSRYDQAIDRLNRLIQQYDGKPKAIENHVDAAFYWKAYAEGKQQRGGDALATLADLQKRYADSRWLKDAKALELELRQASGQNVSPDTQSDEELKLLALRSLMRSDPDRAVPAIEQILAGNSSVNVKENALFVLSQSQTPRAKDIIANAAKSSTNPDVQLKAVRYLGAMGGGDTVSRLQEIYRQSNDSALKRVVIQALFTSRMGSATAGTSSIDALSEIARTEKDFELKRIAIRDLGTMDVSRTGETLRSIYAADNTQEVRKEVINALAIQKNATILVDLAKGEKDLAMKKEIVSKLSTMRSKEATDYMLELLK